MRKPLWITLAIVSIIGAAGMSWLYSQDVRREPVESISREELRDHVYFLASDELEGRYLGSKGFDIALWYGASQFQAAGLEALYTKDDQPTFLQHVPVVKRRVKEPPVLTLNSASGKKAYAHAADYKWIEGHLHSTENKELPVVYVGFGIHEPEYGWDDYSGLDVANKVIILTAGAPVRGGKPVLPEEVHKKYLSVNGLQSKLMGLVNKNTAGVFVLADEQLLKMWDSLPDRTLETRYVYLSEGAGAVQIPVICIVKREVIQDILVGQERTLSQLQAEGMENYRCFPLAEVSLEFDVTYEEEEIPTWNVVGFIKGTDPVLSGEYITVTAHLDHLEPRGGQVCNGADDNASGSAGVMEIAEAVALDPPRRSVIFVLFTKEEGGALGSSHFVSDCPVPIEKVVVNLNLDMIGRTDAYSKGDRSHYALDSDKITPGLKQALMDVNRRTVNWPLKFERPRNAPGVGSDNIIFDMKGIPSIFFYSGSHRDYHRPTDDADKVDYEKVTAISRLVYELTMELGNRDTLW